MPKRAILLSHIAIILLAVAVPIYVRLSFAPDQRLNFVTSTCEMSMIPAFYLAPLILPTRSYSLDEINRGLYDPALDARIYFCVLTGMNVLVWSATWALVLLIFRLTRTRHINPQSI
jgi:hypothetical protein